MSSAAEPPAEKLRVLLFLMTGLIAFDVDPCADRKNNNNKLLQSASEIDLDL